MVLVLLCLYLVTEVRCLFPRWTTLWSICWYLVVARFGNDQSGWKAPWLKPLDLWVSEWNWRNMNWNWIRIVAITWRNHLPDLFFSKLNRDWYYWRNPALPVWTPVTNGINILISRISSINSILVTLELYANISISTPQVNQFWFPLILRDSQAMFF